MSHMLEFPDPLYAALKEAASASGTTPLGWIAANLPRATVADDEKDEVEAEPKKTLAERFAGRVGLIDSGGRMRAAENIGERFAEHLEAKRRAGRL